MQSTPQIWPQLFSAGGLLLYILYKELLVKLIHKDESKSVSENGNGKGMPASWKLDMQSVVRAAVGDVISPALASQTEILRDIRQDLRDALQDRLRVEISRDRK